MKQKIITILAVFILLFSWGCTDYLDVNHDPNVLGEIPEAKVLLPAAEINLANNLMGWDFGFGGAYWVQYWTQNYTASQFKLLCEYDEVNFSTAYTGLTAGVLTDLKAIETGYADSENKGYSFVAEALSIYTWQLTTDIWGNIPYSEALKGSEGIDAPKFDKGNDIYADLLKRIDALLLVDLSKSTLDAKYDFIYEGDLDSWKLFANSLKLKLMLRISETPDYENAKLLTFINDASFLEISAKIPGSVWDDKKEGKRHPMREFQEGGASYLSTNVIACKSFIDYLTRNSDPRVDKLFTAPTGGHKGAFFGDFDSKFDSDDNGTTDDKEKFSTALFTGDMDLMLMSDWEVNFYIAEVYARASDNVNAKKYFDLAVKSSLAQQGITSEAIVETGGYANWTNGSVESGIKQIAMQKWVANANYQHIESFLERNRTKYPAVNEIDIKLDRTFAQQNFPFGDLTVSVNGRAKTNGYLPASPIYPETVLTRNINAPSQKVDLLEKVWWNKKVGK